MTSPPVRSLGRFDTRDFAASALLRVVNEDMETAPGRVLDLGLGGGALSSAARAVWPDAEIVGVDVAPDATAPEGTRVRKVVRDALSEDLSELGLFDVVLCNPPYLPLPPDRHVRGDLVGRGRARGMEAAFVLRALDLVRSGGRVGLILPEAAASAEAYRDLREILIARGLAGVMTLPRGSFVGADPSARLFVLEGGIRRGRSIRLGEVGPEGSIRIRASVSAETAARRCDVPTSGSGPTLAALGADLVRGTLCPGRVKREDVSCVHTTDMPLGGMIVLPDATPAPGLTTARKGDILLARIGRNLHLKTCLVSEGEAPLTDCVFRLRVPEEHRLPVLTALRAGDGELLRLAASGTGTRHLTRRGVMEIRIESPPLRHDGPADPDGSKRLGASTVSDRRPEVMSSSGK